MVSVEPATNGANSAAVPTAVKTRPVSEIAVAPPTASEMDIAALLRALVVLGRGGQDDGGDAREHQAHPGAGHAPRRRR